MTSSDADTLARYRHQVKVLEAQRDGLSDQVAEEQAKVEALTVALAGAQMTAAGLLCLRDEAALAHEAERKRRQEVEAVLASADEFIRHNYDEESHWHECDQRPEDPLAPPNDDCNCQVGLLAKMSAALSARGGGE